MTYQTALGFDFGTKHIGVAIGQTITQTANPLASLRAQKGIPNWDEVTALIEYWKPDMLMVGMPFAEDGSEHTMTRAVRRFSQGLKHRYNIPVHLVDERFTSVAARRFLYERGGYKALHKSCIDGLSAKIIVECGFQNLDITSS